MMHDAGLSGDDSAKVHDASILLLSVDALIRNKCCIPSSSSSLTALVDFLET